MQNLRVYKDNIKIFGKEICQKFKSLIVIDDMQNIHLGILEETKDIAFLQDILRAYFNPLPSCVILSEKFFYHHLRFLDIQEKIYKSQADIKELFALILKEAILMDASDIHLENFNENAWIRFRIDGELCEVCEIEREVFEALCLKIKLESKLDITEIKQSQDGRFNFFYNALQYDFRISCIPTYNGQSLVLRILHKQKQQINLHSLGISKNHLDLILDQITKKHGIILLTGPTGSGKSTTLYAILENFKSSKKKIITLEDPVEYKIPYATQIQVVAESNFSFSQALSAVLRQDPDIIMVGEIRDLKTLELAFRASLTGHLVFATLHTNDTKSALDRLVDMGMSKHNILSSLLMIVSQRLFKKACKNCQKKMEEKYISIGCEVCNFQGFVGREVATEVLVLSKEVKRVIKEDNLEEYLDLIDFETLDKNASKKYDEGKILLD